ncbi:putative exported protein [Bordetella bronchiseptica MO149]|nr:RND transporter [Bordetella bronchiseptica]CCJ57178.1 putative exported protein [Bordetella bronchiseptica MO149]CCN04200.1 putative exported protein [Bordetella bronchiseptica Bbr77]AZW29109.1 RND transporter [Bordetella bronchiseptica]QET69362.1 efflux transporter outer membrane subunit [Bordetella bronchiseptica]
MMGIAIMKHILPRGSALLAMLLVLAGCAVGPQYDKPAVAVPAAYKEAAALPAGQAGAWQAAQPAEDALRGQWWKIFGDPALDALEDEAQRANHSLQAAAARLAQARALQRDARSARFPRVDAGFGPMRQRPSPASQGLEPEASTQASTLWRGQLSVAYEADLFGRVSATVDAATADSQQSEALYRSVLLALQADVAQGYFLIRELDAELRIYRQTVELRGETLKLIQRRYDAGDISELDLARARAELESARAEALGVERRRAAAEHALAVLLGKTPAEFAMPAQPLARVAVNVPAGLPSSLLERRPDIAAAERAMAAANARIGAARAAFFPRLDITGAAGFESAELGQLFEWSSRTFLLGPLVGAALSLPIFDGGRRQASLDRARAVYEEDVANYRQTVLDAFREVEDNLANLRILADQTQAQDAALDASARAARLSHTQYREGSISYLDVIEADRTVLLQQRVAVQLDGERARSAVQLVRALGGGWDTPVPPPSQESVSAGKRAAANS